MTIKARDLWWIEGHSCTCDLTWDDPEQCVCETDRWPPLYRAVLRGSGRVVVTDKYVALLVAHIDNPTQLPTPALMPERAMLRTVSILTAVPLPDVPQKWFATRSVDVLEKAGYRIRALDGERDAHGIVDTGGRVVGAIMPIRILEPQDLDPAKMRVPNR